MKNHYILSFLLFSTLFISFTVTSCKKDDETSKEVIFTALDLEINNFIWENMSMYYLWTSNVSTLNPNNYSTQTSLDTYLKKTKDHEAFFNSLLYKKDDVDRFSWIVDDYESLENQLQGISKSMGFDFALGQIGNTINLFGIVRYIEKNSPAEKAGLKRGDFFTRVNGVQLTKTNYQELLSNESFSIGLAYVSNNTLINDSRAYNIVAQEIQENPIFFDTIYRENNLKIGYLVYNGFLPKFDNELNAVFARFKSEGIQRLILDLRYNPGGAITSAVYLASMIYKNDTTKVFIKNSYNTEFQNYIIKEKGSDYLKVYFADKIEASEDGVEEPIASLGLTSLVVIATKGSASASEIMINGLRAYIPVTIIGDTTYGKFVGSITIKDYNNNGVLNTKHKWALQPIVMSATNANGNAGNSHGLPADILIDENFSNLVPFGDTNDPLLDAAINTAIGSSVRKSAVNNPFRMIAEKNDLVAHSREMYLPSKLAKNRNEITKK